MEESQPENVAAAAEHGSPMQTVSTATTINDDETMEVFLVALLTSEDTVLQNNGEKLYKQSTLLMQRNVALDKLILNEVLPLNVRIKGVPLMSHTLNSIDLSLMSNEQRVMLQKEMTKLLDHGSLREHQLVLRVLLMLRTFYQCFDEEVRFYDGGTTYITRIVTLLFDDDCPVHLKDQCLEMVKSDSHLVVKYWDDLKSLFIAALQVKNKHSHAITQLKMASQLLETNSTDLYIGMLLVDVFKMSSTVLIDTYKSLEDPKFVYTICCDLIKCHQRYPTFFEVLREPFVYIGVLQVVTCALEMDLGNVETGLDILLEALKTNGTKIVSDMVCSESSLFETFVSQLRKFQCGSSNTSRKAVVLVWHVTEVITNILQDKEIDGLLATSLLRFKALLRSSTFEKNSADQNIQQVMPVSVMQQLMKKKMSTENEEEKPNLANSYAETEPASKGSADPLEVVSDDISFSTNNENENQTQGLNSFEDHTVGEDIEQRSTNDEPATKKLKVTLTNKAVVYDRKTNRHFLVASESNKECFFCEDCEAKFLTKLALHLHLKFWHMPNYRNDNCMTWPKEYGEPKIGNSYQVDGERLYLKNVYETRVRFNQGDEKNDDSQRASASSEQFQKMLTYWNSKNADTIKSSHPYQNLQTMLSAPAFLQPSSGSSQKQDANGYDNEELKIVLQIQMKGKSPQPIEVVDLCNAGSFFQTLKLGAHYMLTQGVYIILSKEIVNKLLNPLESAKKAFDEILNFFALKQRVFDTNEKKEGELILENEKSLTFLSGGLLVVKLMSNKFYLLLNFSLVVDSLVWIIGKMSHFVRTYFGV